MSVRLQDSSRTVAILAYHKIGRPAVGENTWFYVGEDAFVRHLRYLRESGWQPLDMTTFLDALNHPERLPSKGVLITFDDGYRSNLTVASPHLERAGFPAIVFVATGMIGGFNVFDRGIEPVERMCSWDDLRALGAQGIAVQSHGVTHTRFSALTAEEVEREVRDSRTVLEDELGQPVKWLSYPFGDAGADPSATRAILAGNGYSGACGYGDDVVNLLPEADPFRLARFAVGSDTDVPTLLERGAATRLEFNGWHR